MQDKVKIKSMGGCLYRHPVSERHPKGAIVVKIRLRGTPKREKTFSISDYLDSVTDCKAAAIAWREAQRAEMIDLKKFSSGNSNNPSDTSSLKMIKTFKHIMDLYKSTPLKKGKNRGKERKFTREEGRYDRLVEELGKYQPWEVPVKLRERCAYWMDTLELEPSTVNRHITMAKCAMQIAYETKYGYGEIRRRLIPENYLDDFQLFEENNIRYRILSDVEREKLWNALPLPLKALYFHALHVPVRKSDLINIRLDQCDQISGCIELVGTKNGNVRNIVMPGWLQSYRNNLPVYATHLHCNTDGTPLGYFNEREGKFIMMSHWEQKFRDACITAGINDPKNINETKYTFHKTRQEAVMLYLQNGHSIDETKAIGDWESDDAFKRYYDVSLYIQMKNGRFSIGDQFKTRFAEELIRKVA